MKKLIVLPDYSMPIFADGNIFLRVENEEGKRVLTHAVAVRGDTHEAQSAFIETERAKLQGYVDMLNLVGDLLTEHDTILAGQTSAMTDIFDKMKALREVLP